MSLELPQSLSDELNKYEAIDSVFDKNETAINAYPPFKIKVGLFNTNFLTLKDFLKKNNISSKGKTESKDDLKYQVASYYELICVGLIDFAQDTHNTDLAAHVNYTKNKLIHTKDGLILPTIESINEFAEPYLNDPKFTIYGITQADLDNGLALAQKFAGSLGENTATQAEQSALMVETEALFVPLRANNKSLRNLSKWYKVHNPTFYNTFTTANEIHHTGRRITRVEGHIFKKGTTEAIKGAYIKNVQTGKTAFADITGHYDLEKFASGDFDFAFGAPGYLIQSKQLHIAPGHSYTIEMELEPA